MNENERVLLKAAEWLGAGKRICIASIVRKEGPAPRPVGTKMVISEGGEIFGTIGGGNLEVEIVRQAIEAMKQDVARCIDYDLSGKLESLDAICGGNVSVLLEPMGKTSDLFIFGSGHVGKATAKIAAEVGFSVKIVDSEDKGQSAQELQTAWTRIIAGPREVKEIGIDHRSYVVICTSGHRLDSDYLRETLPLKPRYIGLLGSKKKARLIFDKLRSEGCDESLLERVHVPVGLDIKAVTPEEIAVSIVAELIAERRSQCTERS